MSKHVLTILEPAKATPAQCLPDGAITGNGDVSVVLAGTADRIRLHISKADFWKSNGRVSQGPLGGIAPMAIAELLLPQLAYAEYKAEQNLDEAYISLSLKEGNLSANLKVTVCAVENTVLVELDRTHPAVSVSFSIAPVEGADAVTDCGEFKDVRYALRGFDTDECRFPTFGICALRQISRVRTPGRERIVWSISVCTNHDTAAYKHQAIERARSINEGTCRKLWTEHAQWWTDFWAKSGVDLPDKQLELYWYSGIYAVACCARNKKFPPGLWGSYATADGMNWFGDYHLNYNYEAPFYGLVSSNHPELIECYASPVNEYLPTAREYAKEYLGIEGAYFPVGIGPLGLETDLRPETKEHGHLFHGQKSNGVYASVIPMMHWYGTRDKVFARREYYDFLLSVAEFWENYLVFEDGRYQIYNDALNEVCWYAGPDQMPQGHDDRNPVVSRGLVRMLMKLMIDLSGELGLNGDRIPAWQHILDHLPLADTFESNGETLLRGIDGSVEVRELALECMYPAGQIGKFSTPALFEAVKNTHKRLGIWDSNNRFCSYYPMAARLEYPAEEIIAHIHDMIHLHGLPNGMFCFAGGGMENSAAIPTTVNEMLLQSYEGVIRLFPVWDRRRDASFHGIRANGAFLIDASLENGVIRGRVLSEKGMPLTLESPGDGYVLVMGDGNSVPVGDSFVTVNTREGEIILLQSKI